MILRIAFDSHFQYVTCNKYTYTIYMYIYLQQQSKILLAKKGVENIIIPMKPTSKVHIREYTITY